MRSGPPADLYSPREIALAAGVSAADVLALVGPDREFVPHDEAVAVGRRLAGRQSAGHPHSEGREAQIALSLSKGPIGIPQSRALPLTLSSTLHIVVTAVALATTFDLSPRAATLKADDRPAFPMRLIFLEAPGPGGGGGGGGLRQKTPAPTALREGHQAFSSPLPVRVPPKPAVPTLKPPDSKPKPPLEAEVLPAIVAPIVAAPADTRSRIGVLAQTTAENDSHGPGAGGGAGAGKGTGLGEGDGSGIGPGSGGGAGGGPYRPGSGIEPPSLLREIKADYTEDARQRGISGEVVLEIVVRHDGSVGDVRVLQGLAGGLNDRAVQAVRQWRFSPAHRQGAAVDVVVEVAVEFKLR